MTVNTNKTIELVPVYNWWLTIAAFIAGALIVTAIVAYIGRNSDE